MAVKNQQVTDEYAIYNADCMAVMKSFPDNKIHLSIYSPPFGGLYNYSSDERDLSNCLNYKHFFEHYDFVVSQIARITIPGRISAVHCTDIPSGNSGADYLTDFPGDVIRLHEKNGFHFIARHTIWKEPLMVRNRTMAKCLAHKTVVDDAAFAGVASADYLLVFRKHGKSEVPISNPVGLSRYAGMADVPGDLIKFRNYDGNQIENQYSHWIWRRYASSVWDDIDIANVLPFKCKDPEDEKHVHPLQLDVIDRVIILRSNVGETVLTPFMGVGSEVYCAVRNNRRGIGIELKETYYIQAQRNIEEGLSNRFVDSEQYSLFESV